VTIAPGLQVSGVNHAQFVEGFVELSKTWICLSGFSGGASDFLESQQSQITAFEFNS